MNANLATSTTASRARQISTHRITLAMFATAKTTSFATGTVVRASTKPRTARRYVRDSAIERRE